MNGEKEVIEWLRNEAATRGSQAALARDIGISGAMLSAVMRGKKKITKRIANFGGFTMVETTSFKNVKATVLPDGSAFGMLSFPLPLDHWLYAPQAEWDSERDDFVDLPRPILANDQREAVIAAARYAIRGATMRGQQMDFDPDAMVLNFAYAMCGPCGGRCGSDV